MTTDATIPTPQGLLERILRFAIAHRWLMLALTVALIAVGSWSFSRLPIDVTPDITNVQVQVNTQVDGYSPLESEQRVTFPIETALAGLPGLDYTRSISRYGLSQVTVVFKDGTDLYFARQQVAERLQQVKSQLPAGLEPEMAPSPPAWARSSCTRWKPTRRRARRTAHRSPPPTCARCRTGSCVRNCATCRA